MAHPAGLPRTALSLDGAWTIAIGSETRAIPVPSNIPFTFGVTTWTKTFTLDLDTPPVTAYLQFDGVVNSGSVMLNGATLGPIYGFSETRFDVSGALIPNGINTLAVTIDDRLTNITVPGGDTSSYLPTLGNLAYTIPIAWANHPGIVRSVSLVYSSQPVISDVYASQRFSADLSKVNVTVSLAVSGPLTPSTGIQAALSLRGTVVGSCLAGAAPDGGLSCNISLDRPALWTPDDPVLYNLSAQLVDSGLLLDAGTDKIGLRKFEARGARFYLNGKPIFLRGITRHDIYGDRGFVPDEQTIRQDILQMKSLGLNFVRSIHYPPTELFSRIADEYGMLISEELPSWAVFADPSVIDVASRMLYSLMSRDYNRASLVAYNLASYGTGTLPDAYLKNLLLIGKTFDSSRLYSFVRDDQSHTKEAIVENSLYARSRQLDYYAQNTYWGAGIFDAVADSLPTDIPFLSTEWSGAEGSERGPLGSSETVSFPSSFENTATYSEIFEAGKIDSAFTAFQNYVCTDARPARCIAGVVYFNWQDVEWPAIGFFFGGHLPWLRSGLVYEDRVMKTWPAGVFSQKIALLPK